MQAPSDGATNTESGQHFTAATATDGESCNDPSHPPTNASSGSRNNARCGCRGSGEYEHGYWHSARDCAPLVAWICCVTRHHVVAGYSNIATAFVRNTESPTAAVRPAACRD